MDSDNLYWTDKRGRIHEFEASTNSGVYAWFRRLSDGESVRLPVADLSPISDAEVLALARAAS
jgi:hypothetical protein